MSSQKRANKPLTHSPRQGFSDGTGRGDEATVVVGGVVVLFLSIRTKCDGGLSPYESRDTQQRNPGLHREDTARTASQ